MTGIVIFGAGGHGRVVAEAAQRAGLFVQFFVDDQKLGETHFGISVISESDFYKIQPLPKVVIAIGNNEVRLKIANSLSSKGYHFAKVIDPTALICGGAFVEDGAMILAGAVVGTGSKIGAHCIVNTKASVDHDCHLDKSVHIAPGATVCGGVKIGECTWVGAGSTLREYIVVGQNCMIGAGSCLIQNIDNGQRVLGVPAR